MFKKGYDKGFGSIVSLDERFRALARDVASCVLVNAGSFGARVPGNRQHPSFVNGEFTVDIFDGAERVGQVIVRDIRRTSQNISEREVNVIV